MDKILTGKELQAAAKNRLRIRCVFFLFNSPEPYYDKVETPEKETGDCYTIGPLTIDIKWWTDAEPVRGSFQGGNFFLFRVFGIEYK